MTYYFYSQKLITQRDVTPLSEYKCNIKRYTNFHVTFNIPSLQNPLLQPFYTHIQIQ